VSGPAAQQGGDQNNMRTTLFLFALAWTTSLSADGYEPPGSSPVRFPERSAAQLYGRFCASCHGRDGQANTPKARFSHARNLTDSEWQNDVSDERIFNSIMNGRSVRGNMPAFNKKISEQEADSLVAYVRNLKK